MRTGYGIDELPGASRNPRIAARLEPVYGKPPGGGNPGEGFDRGHSGWRPCTERHRAGRHARPVDSEMHRALVQRSRFGQRGQGIGQFTGCRTVVTIRIEYRDPGGRADDDLVPT